jgi:predicted nucleotidyltransferase
VKKVGLALPSIGDSSPGAAVAFARHVAGLWDDLLGNRLAGVYLIGSLAHGGYHARYSDIDIALISRDAPEEGEFDLINRKAARYAPALARKASLFWANATFSAGRFPPLDRIDYLDHRVALVERRRVRPKRPTLLQVRSYLSGDPLRKWSAEVMRLSALPELRSRDRKPYLRALLYAARFLYSWETGRVASNDDAVTFVALRNLAGAEMNVLRRALRCRNAEEDIASLFSERHRLRDLLRTCAERVEATPEY